MGLRIANNVEAMNAHRNLVGSNAAMAKSLERLSSGYRINRAADDAAGLSISQSFRADIASFKVASRNTTEASALLQVAEGGMDQISNILTRLKELATQAASSNVGTSDRAKINSEGNALISEIDRIANSTKYGTTALLDGTFGASKVASGTYTYTTAAAGATAGAGVYGALTHVYSAAGIGQTAAIFTSSMITAMGSTVAFSGAWTFSAVGTTLKVTNGTVEESITVTGWSAATTVQTLSFANIGLTLTGHASVVGATLSTQFSEGGTTVINIRETGVSNLSFAGATSGTYTFSSTAAGVLKLGNGTITQELSGITPGTAYAANFSTLGITLDLGTKFTSMDINETSFVVTSSGSGNEFQIGSKNDANNKVSLNISGVGSSTLNANLIANSLDTQTEAQSMLTYIDSAVSALNTTRGNIGASMNRLTYAAANLATTIENTQAAESVIRDVDMAAEMTQFTKSQILMQAGTAMLAQANMAPQGILSLISG